MEWQWDWNTIETRTKYAHAVQTFAYVCIQAKWIDSSHEGHTHLRQNELPVEFSHKHFEEEQKLFFANLISQKLQEEVALRKREREQLYTTWSFMSQRSLCFELSDVPSDSAPAWRVFLGWGHVSLLMHQTHSLPLCSLYWACEQIHMQTHNTTWVRLWSDKAKCCIDSTLDRNILTSAYIKTS